MKVGDLVRFNKNSFFYKKGDRFLGRVTRLTEGVDVENHGTIEVLLLECPKYYLSVGEYEHFVHFNWQKDLEIVEQ
jgi:hypothetical protein